jgi:hypothetical protein
MHGVDLLSSVCENGFLEHLVGGERSPPPQKELDQSCFVFDAPIGLAFEEAHIREMHSSSDEALFEERVCMVTVRGR